MTYLCHQQPPLPLLLLPARSIISSFTSPHPPYPTYLQFLHLGLEVHLLRAHVKISLLLSVLARLLPLPLLDELLLWFILVCLERDGASVRMAGIWL
jgi:hypothetical protein